MCRRFPTPNTVSWTQSYCQKMRFPESEFLQKKKLVVKVLPREKMFFFSEKSSISTVFCVGCELAFTPQFSVVDFQTIFWNKL